MGNAPSGGTITFAPDLRGTIMLTGNLELFRNLTLRGPGAGVLALSSGKHNYIIHIDPAAQVSITGLAFKDSIFRETGDTPGFIVNEGKLSLSNSVISGNRVSQPLTGGNFVESKGGIIYNTGILSLTNSIVSGNMTGDVDGAGWPRRADL